MDAEMCRTTHPGVYDMNRRTVQWLSMLVIAAASFGMPSEAQADTVCASGGPGASACSVAVAGFECSVTCSSGFACCNYTFLGGGISGCHCVGGENQE